MVGFLLTFLLTRLAFILLGALVGGVLGLLIGISSIDTSDARGRWHLCRSILIWAGFGAICAALLAGG